MNISAKFGTSPEVSEYFKIKKRLEEIEGAPAPSHKALEPLVTPFNNWKRPEHAVMRYGDKRFPEMKFEWHPVVRQVHVLRDVNEGKPELVAMEVANEGDAIKVMHIWLRGYRTRDQERTRNPALKSEDY